MIKNISCVIIVRNAQNTLKEVLDSLYVFDDVVIYSNNSTDKTNEIASRYSNVNLVLGTFDGFGVTKNRASTYAKNDWIFSLDADEILTKEFIDNLKKITLNQKEVYSILRVNYYNEKQT